MLDDVPSLSAGAPQKTYRLRRDTYAWLAGSGLQPLTRNTLLSGRLLRSNETYQRLILATSKGVLSLNAEDIEEVTGPKPLLSLF